MIYDCPKCGSRSCGTINARCMTCWYKEASRLEEELKEARRLAEALREQVMRLREGGNCYGVLSSDVLPWEVEK